MLPAALAPVFLAFAGIVVGATLFSIGLAAWRMRRSRRPRSGDAGSVPVTILRPVCGVETFSEETLGSAFHLLHARYEIVFCAASAADPVLPIVRRLMAAHPEVPTRLLVGDDRGSENPKLNNCLKGWAAARHDWVVIADSNVLMPPDYLDRLLSAWRPGTGLVCSTPLGVRPDGFWAEVEVAFLNTLQARWQYAGEALGLGFAQGKSMLLRRSLLEAEGGLAALGAEIAEDAAATKLVRKAGLHVHLVDAPFQQPLGRRRLSEIWHRQLRWARLRRVTFPLFFAPEISSGAVLPVVAGGLWAAAAGWSVAATCLAVAACWYGPELLLARLKGWPLSRRSLLTYAIRDLMLLPMWAYAWVAVRIEWRGNEMAVRTKAAELRATGSAG